VFQDKKVTIVHGDKHLLNPTYPDKARTAAESSVRARGIELVLNDYIDFAETQEVEGISTRSGKLLEGADLVVCCCTSVPLKRINCP
jgi:hypothetical protein